MDEQARADMYTMAEWASTMDAVDRARENKARRHAWYRRQWRFWFTWRQVATVAHTASGEGAPEPETVCGVVGSEPPAPPVGATGALLSQPAAAAPRRPHLSHPAGITFM